ncbi:MAG: hypothetical protein R3D58_15125 [Saprospiraceae bacterium]|nr:hypothetical protein [Lewinellaceae bacterium]
MKKSEKTTWIMAGALLAGMAGEWFLGGTYESHTLTRNIFVGIQLIIGLGMISYSYLKRNK